MLLASAPVPDLAPLALLAAGAPGRLLLLGGLGGAAEEGFVDVGDDHLVAAHRGLREGFRQRLAAEEQHGELPGGARLATRLADGLARAHHGADLSAVVAEIAAQL